MCPHQADRRCWADLPFDLLEPIAASLIRQDYYCFHAVCKRWRSISFPVLEKILRKMGQVPLLVYLKSDTKRINFFNPVLFSTPETTDSSHRKIVVEISNSTDEIEEKMDDIDGFDSREEEKLYHTYSRVQGEKQIRFAKDGWLLISQGNKDGLFCFNPMTKQTVDLPNLPSSNYCRGFSFSTTPTSHGCMVFSINIDPTWIFVSYIRRGEDTWTEHAIYNDSEFVMSRTTNPLFYKGCFYVMGKLGNLGIFNPESNTWSVLDKPEKPCSSLGNCYLIEIDGELASVFVGSKKEWVRTYLLDKHGGWKQTKDLGENILFVGMVGSFSTTIRDLRISGVQNRIHFPCYSTKDGTGIFYDLHTNMFHTFWSQHKDLKTKTGCFTNCAWIEPSYRMHADEELKWLHHNL